MTAAARNVTIAAGVVVFLHVLGIILPSHLTWGVHLFSFSPVPVGFTALVLGVAVILPPGRDAVGAALEAFIRRVAGIPVLVTDLALVALLVTSGLACAAELHLLGDGAILMRSIPKESWGNEVISSFRNQPLLNIVYKWAMALGSTGTTVHPERVYTIINFVGGGLMVLLVSWFARKLPRPPAERLLLGLLLFAGAGTQFFFGYIENYVLQYVATIAYAVTGWMALERRVHVAVPLAILAVLPGFNLGTFIFFPSGLYLLVTWYRLRWLTASAILGGLAALGVGVMLAFGFSVDWFVEKFTGKLVDLLPLFPTDDGNFPYTMFSGWHFVAWFNAHNLVVPFGLLLPAALLPLLPKGEIRNNPVLLFLLLVAACGLAFTWVINCALGMVRDWDMLSSFFIPLAVLDVWLLAKTPGLEPRRGIIAMVTVLSLVHTAAFIGINADDERHLARMRVLDNRNLLSKAARIRYDEALANYFYDAGRYQEAKFYYEDYMEVDSLNTRIIGNISDVYRKLGETEKYFHQLQRGALLGSPNPGVYANLGVEFSSRGDTALAIFWNAKAVELDSMHTTGNANLGILYLGRKEYDRALVHFQRSIRAGMREPKLFLYAAETSVLAKRYNDAIRYYDVYLERAPADERARQQRDRLKALMRER